MARAHAGEALVGELNQAGNRSANLARVLPDRAIHPGREERIAGLAEDRGREEHREGFFVTLFRGQDVAKIVAQAGVLGVGGDLLLQVGLVARGSRVKEIHSIFPVLTLLTKLVGEAMAFFIALVAIGGGIYVWFTGRSVGTIMNPMPFFLPTFGDTTFMGGIEFMVGGVLIAIVSLIIMYAVSDTIGLLSRLDES